MIDVEMLEQLAPPIISGPGNRLPPLDLEGIFARVVSDGWAPRCPAFEPELAGLEVSTVRGTCLNPLLFEGDQVFVDKSMKPLPGDLVSFSLSERGAAAQNSHLTPGKSPVCRGDRWIKLFLPYCGYEMLLENRNSATATLLSCEHPDDSPVLHPVRQVRRNGRLLFTPDSYCAQLGLNAATILVTQTAATTTIASGASYTVVISQTLGPYGYDADIVVTATGAWQFNTGAATDSYQLSAGLGQFTGGSPINVIVAKSAPGTVQPVSTTSQGGFALEQTFTLLAGTTNQFQLTGIGSWGAPATSNYKILGAVQKCEVIFR